MTFKLMIAKSIILSLVDRSLILMWLTDREAISRDIYPATATTFGEEVVAVLLTLTRRVLGH
jgi:hypothetical protein